MSFNHAATSNTDALDIELDFSDIVAMDTETNTKRGAGHDHVTNTGSHSTLVALLQITCHVISSALSVLALTSERGNRQPEVTAYVTMATFLVASHVIGNAFSLAQIYRSMDFSEKKTAEFLCVSMHLLLLGPIWRGVRLLVTKEREDILELNYIRLIATHLGDLPFIIVQTYLIFGQSERLSPVKTTSVISSFAALYVAIMVHNYMFRLTFLKSSPRKSSLVIDCLSHFMLLLSRCLALALFLFAWRRWLVLLLTGHSLLVVVCLYLSNAFSKHTHPLSPRTVASWLVQYADWLELNTEQVKGHRTAFYVIVACENLAVGVCFLAFRSTNTASILAVGILTSCLVIGLLCKLIKAKLSSFTPINTAQRSTIDTSGQLHREPVTFEPVSEISATFTNPAFTWSENIRAAVHRYSNVLCHNDSGFLSKNDDSLELTTLPPRYDVTVLDTAVKDYARNVSNVFPNSSTKEEHILSSTPRKLPVCTLDPRDHRQDGIDVIYDVKYRSETSANRSLPFPRMSSYHVSGSNTFPRHTSSSNMSACRMSSPCLSTSSSMSTSHLSTSYLSSSHLSSCTETLCEFCSCAYPADIERSVQQTGNGLSLTWPNLEKASKCTLFSLPKDTVSWRDSVLTWLDKYTTSNIQ